MKILILGTSNSIAQHGWVVGLRHVLPDAEITNLSVGASPGLQFATRAKMDFSAYDFVVFDTLPNDESYFFMTPGYRYGALQERVVFEICSTIAAQTRLIIFAICNYQYFIGEISEPASKLPAVAQACGAQLIDVREILRKIFARTGGNSRRLYGENIAHPKEDIACLLGRAIGKGLSEALPLPGSSRPVNYQANFEIWPEDHDDPAYRPNLLANRFLSETFYNLQEHEVLQFPRLGRLLGFYVNYYTTACSVTLDDGEGNHVGAFNMFYDFNERGVMKLFVPLPVPGPATAIRVHAKPIHKAIVPRMAGNTPRPDQKTGLAISTLAFWSGNEDAALPAAICHATETQILAEKVYTYAEAGIDGESLFKLKTVLGE